jgi:curli production assembly/transport component CsgG/holdfast attachment protein HfaB
LGGLLSAVLLSACTSLPPPGDEPKENLLQGPVPFSAETPSSQALRCLARYDLGRRDLRVAVGEIPDLTGRYDFEDTGSFATQGATYMMVTALGQAGVRQVNRSTLGIAEFELNQAIQQRLGEGRPILVGNQQITYRPVPRGAFLGSTHYITGAITELDFNAVSGGVDVSIGGIGGAARYFLLQIGLDLAVTETQSTEIVLGRGWRKQLVGYEVEADVFRFFEIGGDDELFDINIGEQPNEPLQGAVRWIIETAAFDLLRDLYVLDGRCEPVLGEAQRRHMPAAVHARAEADAPGPAADTPDTEAAPAAAEPPGDTLNPEERPLEPTANGAPPGPRPSGVDCRFVNGRWVCGRLPETTPNPAAPEPPG